MNFRIPFLKKDIARNLIFVVCGLGFGFVTALISNKPVVVGAEIHPSGVAFNPEQKFGISILPVENDPDFPFRLEISNFGKKDVKIRYSIELFDDRGVSKQQPFISSDEILGNVDIKSFCLDTADRKQA